MRSRRRAGTSGAVSSLAVAVRPQRPRVGAAPRARSGVARSRRRSPPPHGRAAATPRRFHAGPRPRQARSVAARGCGGTRSCHAPAARHSLAAGAGQYSSIVLSIWNGLHLVHDDCYVLGLKLCQCLIYMYLQRYQCASHTAHIGIAVMFPGHRFVLMDGAVDH